MTQTTTTFNITIMPSKKDILYRLFNEGHITFDELWLLAENTVVNNYFTQPEPDPFKYVLPYFELPELPYNQSIH